MKRYLPRKNTRFLKINRIRNLDLRPTHMKNELIWNWPKPPKVSR